MAPGVILGFESFILKTLGHFHVPAFILARITEGGVLSVMAFEECAGFALIVPKGFDLLVADDEFLSLPALNA